MKLLSQRLFLRPVERVDLPLRVKWINDPEVNQTLSFARPVSLASTEAWFARALGDSSRLDFTIFCRETESQIGFCGLLGIDLSVRKAELYITIGEKLLWGKGVSTECHEILERLAFEDLGLNRLYSFCSEHNLATQRVKEKRGWSCEGRLREDNWSRGRYYDRLVYGLLRAEWREG